MILQKSKIDLECNGKKREHLSAPNVVVNSNTTITLDFYRIYSDSKSNEMLLNSL